MKRGFWCLSLPEFCLKTSEGYRAPDVTSNILRIVEVQMKKEFITIDIIIMAEFLHRFVELGIIKGIGISIDTTHTEANTFKCKAERVM